MSTVFNSCDSISRFVPSTGTDCIIDNITATTTPVEFEKMRKNSPQFQLWHCNNVLRETVLHKAAQRGNVPLIRYLLDKAPELLERGSSGGNTPLWDAFLFRHLNAMETLLALGANPNIICNDFFHASLLHLAAKRQLSEQEYGSHLEAAKAAQSVKLLLKYGAVRYPNEVSSKDKMIESIIQKASQEVAEERRQEQEAVAKRIYHTKLLPPSDLCKLVSQYI
jgi:hypothetical protein